MMYIIVLWYYIVHYIYVYIYICIVVALYLQYIYFILVWYLCTYIIQLYDYTYGPFMLYSCLLCVYTHCKLLATSGLYLNFTYACVHMYAYIYV